MSEQKSLTEQMSIDTGRVSGIITGFISKMVKEKARDGVLLGLSGGIDSAVAATLAARAVPPAKVHAFYLFERDNEKKSRRYAQTVADKLGINFEARSIRAQSADRNTYRPLVMKVVRFWRPLNRLIIWSAHPLYHILLRENPYALTLRREAALKNGLAKLIYRALPGPIEESFNARHIIRRAILEDYAAQKNLLLLGAANRSESFVGWFVKDGVDDLPIEPLLGLYKTQVRQLARFLDVPAEIIAERPSPDMLRGVGDEAMIGYLYEKIDKVAYVVEHSLDPELAFSDGITAKEFADIQRFNRLSAWKRANDHISPTLE